MLGSLDSRKAIPELLAAFKAAALAPKDRLLLAGRLAPAYAALIAANYRDLVRDGRLVVLDRFLTDDELEHGYEALDLATIVYYKFPGLASLALKAVAAGTPIIANDFGWLRAAIGRFQCGETTNIFDQEKFSNGLRTAIEREREQPQSEAVRRLLTFHTETNFVAQMTRGLRHASSTPDVPCVNWDWVTESLPLRLRNVY